MQRWCALTRRSLLCPSYQHEALLISWWLRPVKNRRRHKLKRRRSDSLSASTWGAFSLISLLFSSSTAISCKMKKEKKKTTTATRWWWRAAAAAAASTRLNTQRILKSSGLVPISRSIQLTTTVNTKGGGESSFNIPPHCTFNYDDDHDDDVVLPFDLIWTNSREWRFITRVGPRHDTTAAISYSAVGLFFKKYFLLLPNLTYCTWC